MTAVLHEQRTTVGSPLIAMRHVSKAYVSPAGDFMALRDVSLEFHAGEFAAVIGHSGSGKSTLLALLAGIDRPTEGEVLIDGVAVHALPERKLAAWRGKSLGIVFQFFQLLPTLTACENVLLPMDFCNNGETRFRRERALALLDQLGVADQADKLPGKLSGGQQQRVAVARALANNPSVILADEPTGNLDSRTAGALLELLASVATDGRTVVMVTHEEAARAVASRTVTLSDGCVVTTEHAYA